MKYQEFEKFKGDLDGKAQLLSKLLGHAELKGAVEAERNTIFQSADHVLAAWQASYLSYVFCAKVMSDENLSTQIKIDAWRQFHQAMQPQKSGDIIQGHLTPAQYDSPPSACNSGVKPGDAVLYYGNSAAVTSIFPHAVLRIRGRDVISLNRDADGALTINMEILGSDGRAIVEIKDNVFTVNPNNFFSMERPDKSSLIVYDRHKEKVVDIEYLNEAAIRVTGVIHYADQTVKIGEGASNIGGWNMSASCSRGYGADVVVE